MDALAILVIIFFTLVGLGCGIAIFLANRFLPEEDESLQKTEKISQYLPGMNCGACGKPGCFAYAGEVANDVDVLKKSPCAVLTSDEGGLEKLGEALGIDLSGGVKNIAIVHCAGDSDLLYDYMGVSSCKGAAQLSGGYNKCPYGCLGLGDCSEVCPVEAISMDKEKRVVKVDPAKCIGCGLCTKECPHNLIEIVPAGMPQYLACNYLSKKNIPGRERCSIGCIHCKMCVKASEHDEVTWNDKVDLPFFDPEKLLPAPAAIEKCPRNVIFKRDVDRRNN